MFEGKQKQTQQGRFLQKKKPKPYGSHTLNKTFLEVQLQAVVQPSGSCVYGRGRWQ